MTFEIIACFFKTILAKEAFAAGFYLAYNSALDREIQMLRFCYYLPFYQVQARFLRWATYKKRYAMVRLVGTQSAARGMKAHFFCDTVE